jgi:peptidyl-prolyl cis-trans isomerase D
MISWMQKHNKYLVWTIWIATIAFIGAGFVGWGSYSFGSKAGNIAKVGDIEIKQAKLNMVYNNVYGQYNQMLKGKLDDKKAREMGLIKQAFSTIETQAKILNFAKDTGIVVSDEELVTKLETIKGFQKEGKFNREIYDGYLKSQRLKAKDFEATLRDEIIIGKTLGLLETETLPLEMEAIGAAMNVADKLAYKVLSTSDVNYVSDEAKVKAFWETQKENYMTTKAYDLSFVWTPSNNAVVSDEELKNYYEANSFNYTNAKGKQLSFDEAKETATKDLKLKKTKKSAQKAYIAFKKGTIQSSETITLPLGDLKLTPTLWNEIETKSIGDILKPKVVGAQYVTVKINSVQAPKVMTYEQAKEKVTTIYDVQAKKEALLTLAESTLKTLDTSDATVSDFVTLTKRDNLKSLNSQESLQFLQKLFTSNKEKGIISVLDKVIVYNIIEQKLLSMDANQTDVVKQTVNQMKKKIFESNLLKMLDKQYPTEVYMGGLIN